MSQYNGELEVLPRHGYRGEFRIYPMQNPDDKESIIYYIQSDIVLCSFMVPVENALSAAAIQKVSYELLNAIYMDAKEKG